MTPALPISAAQEAERLQALAPYVALASQQNPVFSEVALLTARLFAAPMAQVSLVGEEEVIYPGNVGSPPLASRLRRADSICAVAVYQPGGPTVYTDLRAQPCQWVSAEAQQDFAAYASYPIKTEAGHPIGSLCVLDVEPREFGAGDQLVLQRLADLVMRLLDVELAAPLTQAPVLWAAIESRIQFSLQRIETLTALARWEESTTTPAAQAYQTSLHDERLLIVRDIEYQVNLLAPTADDRASQ